MDQLIRILKEEMAYYAGLGANSYGFPLFDDEHQTYALAIIDYPSRKRHSGFPIFARVVGDKIIIEDDFTDKPLYKALLSRGIPREQMILIYTGEGYPEGAVPSEANPFLLNE